MRILNYEYARCPAVEGEALCSDCLRNGNLSPGHPTYQTYFQGEIKLEGNRKYCEDRITEKDFERGK